MRGLEQAIFTNMCMVTDNAGNALVLDRKDPKWSGIVFPGGHVECGEPFAVSVIREVFEESGLTIESPKLCGVKQFMRGQARYVVLLYTANTYSGTLTSCEEGEVFWAPIDKLFDLPLAKDFEYMLQVFLDPQLSECYYDKTTHQPTTILY